MALYTKRSHSAFCCVTASLAMRPASSRPPHARSVHATQRSSGSCTQPPLHGSSTAAPAHFRRNGAPNTRSCALRRGCQRAGHVCPAAAAATSGASGEAPVPGRDTPSSVWCVQPCCAYCALPLRVSRRLDFCCMSVYTLVAFGPSSSAQAWGVPPHCACWRPRWWPAGTHARYRSGASFTLLRLNMR